MRARPGFISDLVQVANGAASAFGSMREEIENIVSARTERALNARGLVTREEFDALRTRHEALAARLAVIEADRAAAQPEQPEQPATKPSAAAKQRAKAKKVAGKSAAGTRRKS